MFDFLKVKTLQSEYEDIKQIRKDMEIYNQNLIDRQAEYEIKYQQHLSLMYQGLGDKKILQYLIDNKEYSKEDSHSYIKILTKQSFEQKIVFNIYHKDNEEFLNETFSFHLFILFLICVVISFAMSLSILSTLLHLENLCLSPFIVDITTILLSIYLIRIIHTKPPVYFLNHDKKNIERFKLLSKESNNNICNNINGIMNSEMLFSNITKDKEYV